MVYHWRSVRGAMVTSRQVTVERRAPLPRRSVPERPAVRGSRVAWEAEGAKSMYALAQREVLKLAAKAAAKLDEKRRQRVLDVVMARA